MHIDYQIARSLDERFDALHLVYEAYLQAGLIESNEHRMRVTPYHLLPSTTIFTARRETGEVIFTMSLVGDADLGVPMETIYEREINDRRLRGLRMAEVSCLAADPAKGGGGFEVFIHLCRLMTAHALWEGYDELVIAVHPRHAKFYRRMLAFEVFGELREYPSVKDHPAVALNLDLHTLHRLPPKLYRFLREARYRPSDLFAPPLDEEDRLVLADRVNGDDYPLPTLGFFEPQHSGEQSHMLVR